MVNGAKQLLQKIYDGAQEHEMSMRFLLLLKETGFPRKMNYWLTCVENRGLRKHPSEDMLRSQKFYKENSEMVKHISDLLADKMSKNTWEGVLGYRTKRTPISPELCLVKNQYFVDDIIRVEDSEVFIDVGAYVGDTIKPLLAQAEEKHVTIKRIVAFEPGDLNYKMLKSFYGERENIELVKKGLSDQTGTLYFSGSGQSVRLADSTEQGKTAVPVTRLDDVPSCSDATWIKMDIEGAEMSALACAKETILRNHPKLSICIYHSDEDMLQIPEYIHELVPEYKLYIRHHTRSKNETVLYAIP